MYVSSVICDCWRGLESQDRTIENPSWEDIETALRNLDGEKRTAVSLLGKGEAHLVVGGGSLGRYTVYATFDNDNFLSLSSSDGNSPPVRLNVGGQEGDYPSKIVVELSAALAAAKIFFESGQLAATQQWLSNLKGR
jgi:hypothetical protein